MRRTMCFKMSRGSLTGAQESKRYDDPEQASTSASMMPTWRPAICVASQALATMRVVKRSKIRLRTGRTRRRNTRHKPMSSEGARLVDLSCSTLPLLHHTASLHGRVCDHVKRIECMLAASSRATAFSPRRAGRHRHGLHDVLGRV